MNINNIINKLNINIDFNIKCNYLKIMVFIINSYSDSESDSINFINTTIKENLDDLEIKILNSKSYRGQWKLFGELSNFEMKYYLNRLIDTEIGSLILFIPNELSFNNIIFIKNNIIYNYKRNVNNEYELKILSNII